MDLASQKRFRAVCCPCVARPDEFVRGLRNAVGRFASLCGMPPGRSGSMKFRRLAGAVCRSALAANPPADGAESRKPGVDVIGDAGPTAS